MVLSIVYQEVILLLDEVVLLNQLHMLCLEERGGDGLFVDFGNGQQELPLDFLHLFLQFLFLLFQSHVVPSQLVYFLALLKENSLLVSPLAWL